MENHLCRYSNKQLDYVYRKWISVSSTNVHAVFRKKILFFKRQTLLHYSLLLFVEKRKRVKKKKS